MITINDILSVKNYIDDFDAFIFDLDDTLYSEIDYVKSGFKAVSIEKYDEMMCAFKNGEQVFNTVFPNEKDKMLDIYRKHTPTIKLYPGVKELLTEIKAKKKKIGLITDGRPNGQRKKITALRIENFFDKIIITDELGGIEYRKPNLKAFEIMSNELRVDYNRMVYIGDNAKKDFTNLKQLGIEGIYFKNLKGLKK